MRPFDYASPTRVEDVLRLLAADGDGRVRPLAGGTDLLPLMKADVVAPARLVNVKGLPDLAGIDYDPARGLRLGGLTRLAEIETSPLVRERYPLLAEALAVAATPQLRNMATLAGNLLQRSRCWYFRTPRFHCWLKGGDACPARDGESQVAAILGGGPCYSAHPSDAAPALLALDAEVRLRGPLGERTLALADLFASPEETRRTETVLASDELLLQVAVPMLPAGTRGTYLKAMDRKLWAFALVGVAAVGRVEHGRVAHARLALSGVAPIPWRARAAEEALLGAEPTAALFARAADAALADAAPLAKNGYKLPLARALIRRALAAVLGDGAGA
jgi:xanthine dehydrogenase YagS FAD-binding subunit